MRPLRVTFVAPFGLCRRGTTRARVLPLAAALAGLGHQMRVVIPDWDCPDDAGRCYTAGGAQVAHLGSPDASRRLVSPRLLQRTYRAALAGNPDVVHCFKPIGYSAAVALALRYWGRRAGWRGLLAVDTDDLEGRSGWAQRDHRPPWQIDLIDWQEGRALRAADVVTAATAYLGQAARRARRDQSAYYLPNGAPAVAAPPLDRRSGSQPTVLLYTRFNEFSPHRAGPILAGVAAQVPTVRFCVVGDGPALAREAFQYQLRRRGLDARVDYRGMLYGADLAAALSADTVALWLMDDTPINRARSPAKLLELLAYGRPVVAEATGEVVRLVGDAAAVIPNAHEQRAIEVVSSLLLDPSRRQQFARLARQRAATLGWSRVATQLQEEYILHINMRA